MSNKKSSIRDVAFIGIIFGLISITIVSLLFLLVFPSAWLFFIIPAVMGWSIEKLTRIPKEELHDDESFNKLRKRTGLLCAGMVLIAIILANLIVILLGGFDPLMLLYNFIFYIVCGLSVYWGYSRGVRAITDMYYDSID